MHTPADPPQLFRPNAEQVPDENQIRDCMAQLQSGSTGSYGSKVQKYARLRLLDFKDMLAEWQNPAYPLPASAQALPKAAAALTAPLTPEQGGKLAAFLQQQAQNGNTTAMLHLAYLHLIGRHLPASLKEAARHIRAASRAGDWRASRLWAEVLTAAPEAAEDFLETDAQEAALHWQTQNSSIALAKIPPALQRYYTASAAVKTAAKEKLELAVTQGSPTAAQRLNALTVLGDIPRHPPAPQFQSVAGWLNLQLLPAARSAASDDPDIMLLPDNVPLLPQGDEEDDKPAWFKPAIYGAIALIIILVFVLMLKMLLNPNTDRVDHEPNHRNPVSANR